MLAIRLQRRGRKGLAQYRVVVQDKDLSPKSGRVVYNLGPYNPHTKEATINKEKADYYLSNGAQPSNTAAKLLKKEGVKLPKWVDIDTSKKKTLKDAEKLRKNQPDEPAETPSEPEADKTEASEEKTEDATEKKVETKAEEPAEVEKTDVPNESKEDEKTAEPEAAEESTEEPTSKDK